ncbi:MAG: DUF1461 domain-containing protein [Actinomycetes bacterium]|jgi:hypothetical protein|nr:DUF1461 domain-containing protein [Actinomycetes bacterium]
MKRAGSVVLTVLIAICLLVACVGASLAIVCADPIALRVVASVHPEWDDQQQSVARAISRTTLRYVAALPFGGTAQAPRVNRDTLDVFSDADESGQGGTAVAPYTTDELAHLRDVRVTFGAVFGLALGAAVVAVILVALWVRRATGRRALFVGGIVTMAVPALIALALGVAFDWFFELFHRVLYPQGNWQFAGDSLLITLFPADYWSTMGMIWMGVLFVLGALLFVWGLLLVLRHRRRASV